MRSFFGHSKNHGVASAVACVRMPQAEQAPQGIVAAIRGNDKPNGVPGT